MLVIKYPKVNVCKFYLLAFETSCSLAFACRLFDKVGEIDGKSKINDKVKMFQIRINWSGTESREEGRKGFLQIGTNGVVMFAGKAIMGKGISLIVDCGTLTIGDNFSCNRNCCISCNDQIYVGNNVIWGWNVELLDSDNHIIVKDGMAKVNKESIIIGNNVWLAAYVHILKGSEIAKGTVVGYRSLVVGKFQDENVILIGSPATITNHSIEWIRNRRGNIIEHPRIKNI